MSVKGKKARKSTGAINRAKVKQRSAEYVGKSKYAAKREARNK